jgi:hypothetical protein
MLRTERRGRFTRCVQVTWVSVVCALWLTAAPALAGPVWNDGPPLAHSSIAGGYFPDPAAWPWTTAVIDLDRAATNGDFNRNFCTATLIAPQRVLTAAHCVVGDDRKTPKPNAHYQVLVGRKDLTLVNQGERRNVVGVVVHPKAYLPATGVHQYHAFYDLAVLFLDRPVTTIPPAVIGTPDDWTPTATVMGFGHYNYDHQHPKYDQYLRAADFDLWGDTKCAPWFANPNSPGVQHYFPSIHVCVNNAPGDKYDCITHGDSGGPLMIFDTDEQQWKLIGVTSFYPQYYNDRCGAGGPFGFAWVAGAEMRNWPLTVPQPAVTSNNGGGTSVDTHLARSWLRGYVRSMIRAHTNGKIRKLHRHCVRQDSSSFACSLRFRVKRVRYTGHAAIWVYADNGTAYWTYAFNGKKQRVGSHRSRHVKW